MIPKEIRTFECEMRAEQNAEHGTFIAGQPIVYGQEIDMGWYREVIDRGAIDGMTNLKDVRLLIGHNTMMVPLARSRNNNSHSTMQLSPVETGMDMRANLDTENNQDAKTLYSATERGDISGMSFAFRVDKDAWEDLDTEKPLRHVTHIASVLEVSAVAFPAYDKTSIKCASEDAALDSVRVSLESARQQLAEERSAKEKAEKAEHEKQNKNLLLIMLEV